MKIQNSTVWLGASRLSLLAVLIPVAATVSIGQNLSNQAAGANAPPAYVSPSSVPLPVREYVQALGDRIQSPGKGRATLSGIYKTENGSGSAQLIWQIPGQIRFDRSDQLSKPLIFSSAMGLVSASSTSEADADVLESLLDDSPESFLYGFQGGVAHRFLGGPFRADDGSTPNYQGPWYDIYEAAGPVHAQPGTPQRQKFYYFDSQTKLLAKVQYVVDTKRISTEFSMWNTLQNQSFPGQIVRRENGAIVFTLTVANASFGPALTDSTFATQ